MGMKMKYDLSSTIEDLPNPFLSHCGDRVSVEYVFLLNGRAIDWCLKMTLPTLEQGEREALQEGEVDLRGREGWCHLRQLGVIIVF
jgi:hypothetical protein